MAEERDRNSPRIVNRKARHNYHILQSLEVGVVLKGSEVKSVRAGQVSLGEGFAMVEPADTTLTLYDVDIATYAKAHGGNSHEPKRPRRLLAHKREIRKMLEETRTGRGGRTLVPLTMYFVRGMVKIELGLAEGKRAFDKRQDIKKREADRDIRRGMSRRM